MTRNSLVILLYSFLNPEPVSCSIQGSNCCFLTGIQVYQETSKTVCYSHLNPLLDTAWPFRGTKSAPSTRTLGGTQCRAPHPNNKQDKNTKPISQQDSHRQPQICHLTQPDQSEGKKKRKKKTLFPLKCRHKSPPHKDSTDHLTKLTHPQKPEGRRNTTLGPGKGDLQGSKLEEKEKEKTEKYRANEGIRYKLTKNNQEIGKLSLKK